MSNLSDPPSAPPTVKRVALAMRYTGWISFWMQLILEIVASIILLFAAPFIAPREGSSGATNPGTGGGLFLAVCGLLVLAFSIYWSFRYTRLARKLRSPDPITRPKRADIIKWIRIGLITNLVGLFLTVMGAEAISGNLLAKSLSQPTAFFDPTRNFRDFIQPLDIFIVLANTHAIFGHFIGLVAGMWLLDRTNQP